MNKKNKKKREEEEELPSKKCSHLHRAFIILKSITSLRKYVCLAVIPYHVSICTGLERDASTTSRAYVIIIGVDQTQTQRLWLDLPGGRKGFQAGSLESFEVQGSDVGEIKKVEVSKRPKLLDFQLGMALPGLLSHPHIHQSAGKVQPCCLK